MHEFEAEYTAALSENRMMHIGDNDLVLSPYWVQEVQSGYRSA